ncbi:6462_t:CDS:2 [Scutellospora calospora]|uniref:6462_t:CDS:1 n=1 Tax=Scutellospora calospora TaxID=85575 RepID=A0ACA9KT68_9GLOM|nr:6462_t:CDS:2 [Scutellospora calospora]
MVNMIFEDINKTIKENLELKKSEAKKKEEDKNKNIEEFSFTENNNNILGLNEKANDVEIKKMYRKLILIWHSDKNINNKEESEKKTKQITEVYRIITEYREKFKKIKSKNTKPKKTNAKPKLRKPRQTKSKQTNPKQTKYKPKNNSKE